MDYPQLKNAPIVEAIIEVQFQDVKNRVTVDDLNFFIKELENKYPKNSPIISTEIGFTLENNDIVNQDPKKTIDGYRMENSNHIIQCMKNRLSLSRLPPYESFISLKEEFLENWTNFSSYFNKLEISRVGVRYINKFNTPLDALRDFIKFQDNMFNLGSGALLQSHMSRVMLLNTQFDCRGIINFLTNVIQDEKKQSQLEVIFDVDVYKDQVKNLDAESLKSYLDQLGEYKNMLFFENIKKEKFE